MEKRAAARCLDNGASLGENSSWSTAAACGACPSDCPSTTSFPFGDTSPEASVVDPHSADAKTRSAPACSYTLQNSQTTSDLAGSDQPLIAAAATTQLATLAESSPNVLPSSDSDEFPSVHRSVRAAGRADGEESPPPDPSTARVLPALHVVISRGKPQSQLVFGDL